MAINPQGACRALVAPSGAYANKCHIPCNISLKSQLYIVEDTLARKDRAP